MDGHACDRVSSVEYSQLIHTAFSLGLASLGQTVLKEAYAVTASLQP